MPAASTARQRAAGAALSAKRGEMPADDSGAAARSMDRSMTGAELEAPASTGHRDLPDHAEGGRPDGGPGA